MAKSSKSSTSQHQATDAQYGVCSLPKVAPRVLPAGLHPNRLRLIRQTEKAWVNETKLHYHFFDRPTDGLNGNWVGTEPQKSATRQAFQEWKDLGIGLKFEEASDREDAEIRIGFMTGDGSWSYLGRDVIDEAPDPNERTMNFGWDLTTPYGHDTALHEIGHTLGFPHEHQNPNSGIVWNESAVLAYFSQPPNSWNEETIRWNILRKLSQSEVGGSAWDPNSIMHYELPAGVIEEPANYRNGLTPALGLSGKDVDWVKRFYPPIEEESTLPELRPFESQRLLLAPGEQLNFAIRPRFTRNYVIQTFGRSDTVIVLFENVDGETQFVAGDDDSGFGRNSRISVRMNRGREYILRIRLYYSDLSGETAVFMW